MPEPRFGPKPTVLRCSRCGKFVDWEDARLQIVCSCKPRIELPPVFVRESTDADRQIVRELFERDFGRTSIVAFGEVVPLEDAPVLVAEMKNEIAGALAYRSMSGALHVVALATDPMWQRAGVGAHLLAEAELLARRLDLGRILIATTNDNLPALYFYQRRGYRIADVVPGGVRRHLRQRDVSGFGGIHIRDEIRLEKTLG